MAAASVSYLCLTCKDKNTETEAKAYCKKCDSCFCDNCVNFHSQLFQNHTTYGPEEMEKWPVAMATQEFLENCEVHNRKKLKLFCKDHSQLCCNTCVMLNHRQCSKLTLIADTILSAKDYQQLSAKMNTRLGELIELQTNLIELQTNWETNLKSLQVSYEVSLKKLRSMRKRINDAIDKLEKATRKEMDDLIASWNASLMFDVDTCSRLSTELTHLSDAIQDIGKKNKELTFIAFQKSEEMFKKVHRYLNINSIQTEVSLELIVNNDIERYLSNLSGLGNTIHITKQLTMQGSPDRAIILTGEPPVIVRISSDINEYCINGICGLFNGQIVVADTLNKRLKLLDLQHEVVSDCEMSGTPYDMCLFNPCKVAVAVDTYVQFFSVNSGQLVKDRELQLQHECRGVAHHQGYLYVTSGTALYKYNLTDRLGTKMYEDTSSIDTVMRCALSPNGDKIYVTNYSQSELLTFSTFTDLELQKPYGIQVIPAGQVLVCGFESNTLILVREVKKKIAPLATFTDVELQKPYCIQVTPAGQVLVCGYQSSTVLQVDREGKKKIATLATNGLKSPRSVFYSLKYGSVIVGQSDENILVFNLKIN